MSFTPIRTIPALPPTSSCALHRIDWRDYQARKAADCLRINPAGQLPGLLGDDGSTVHEFRPCLAGRHPEVGLAPPPHDADGTAFLQWLFYLASTLHWG